ncbi:MAG TPA: quinone oxidoreductase [Euzebyales bacterium]|nr:quinone oxidoreductase [Euzebyales bacterium]
MQAIRVEQHGGPEALVPREIDDPTPADGQIRVRVAAAGLNFIDIYHRRGQYKLQLPITIGQEGAGVVDAVAPGVTAVAVGDRVAWTGQMGSYAELVCIPADRAVTVPESVDLRIAAAVMLQGMTAHYLVTSTFPLQAGHTVLIHAGAGGVGQLLIQLAKRAGARVLTTVSTAEKAELARAAGADDIINYVETDFAGEVQRLVPDGLDVVYESVGRDTFERSLRCLRMRGYLVLYGQSSGPVDPLDPQRLAAGGSLFLTRPTLGHYIATREELLWRSQELFELIGHSRLKVRIDREFPLAHTADAHIYMEQRRTRGKVLILP